MWTFDVELTGVQCGHTSAQSLTDIIEMALTENGLTYSSMKVTSKDQPRVSFEREKA